MVPTDYIRRLKSMSLPFKKTFKPHGRKSKATVVPMQQYLQHLYLFLPFFSLTLSHPPSLSSFSCSLVIYLPRIYASYLHQSLFVFVSFYLLLSPIFLLSLPLICSLSLFIFVSFFSAMPPTFIYLHLPLSLFFSFNLSIFLPSLPLIRSLFLYLSLSFFQAMVPSSSISICLVSFFLFYLSICLPSFFSNLLYLCSSLSFFQAPIFYCYLLMML